MHRRDLNIDLTRVKKESLIEILMKMVISTEVPSWNKTISEDNYRNYKYIWFLFHHWQLQKNDRFFWKAYHRLFIFQLFTQHNLPFMILYCYCYVWFCVATAMYGFYIATAIFYNMQGSCVSATAEYTIFIHDLKLVNSV